MSKGDNSPGTSKLAKVLKDITSPDDQKGLVLDFGLIQGDYSLVTNTYPIPIPADDYLVCRTAALPSSEVIRSGMTTAKNKGHGHGFDEEGVIEAETDSKSSPEPHKHNVTVPLADVKTSSASVMQEQHDHPVDIARPSQRPLAPGDRVLVAWVFNDAVVIDIIYSASELRGG